MVGENGLGALSLSWKLWTPKSYLRTKDWSMDYAIKFEMGHSSPFTFRSFLVESLIAPGTSPCSCSGSASTLSQFSLQLTHCLTTVSLTFLLWLFSIFFHITFTPVVWKVKCSCCYVQDFTSFWILLSHLSTFLLCHLFHHFVFASAAVIAGSIAFLVLFCLKCTFISIGW